LGALENRHLFLPYRQPTLRPYPDGIVALWREPLAAAFTGPLGARARAGGTIECPDCVEWFSSAGNSGHDRLTLVDILVGWRGEWQSNGNKMWPECSMRLRTRRVSPYWSSSAAVTSVSAISWRRST